MSLVRKLIPLTAILGLALASCAGVQSQTEQRTIAVTGSGSTRLAPDIVLITLGVETQGSDVGQAVQDNNQRAAQVMSALRDLGVADKDIRTVNFSVYSQTKPEPVPAGSAEPAQINYTVDNTVSVTLRDPGKLGNLLQAALDKGANSVQSVTYSVDDPSKAMDEARKKAMEDARSQATELATAASVQLGKVITVSENVSIPQPVYAAPSYGKGGGGAGAVPTSAGMLEVQAQLTVVFAIE